jgi:polar amino acid transport system permease protein
MADFSFYVILENLLKATQWTVILSLVAFVSGGLV